MTAKFNPLISIIVPVYNVSQFIENCVISIIKQSYQNIEIILVDDGSTDNSLGICKKLQKSDERIVVIHKENGGVSSARNIGIRQSKGEFVCFVDGDDSVSYDYVDYLYTLCVEHSCNISLTTELFNNYNKKNTKKEINKEITGKDAAVYLLSYRIPIGCYCKLFKKSFLLNTGIEFYQDLIMGEGFNFNFQCFQASDKVAIGNRKVYYYRQDNVSSATTVFSLKKCLNGLKAIERIRTNNIFSDELTKIALDFATWRTTTDMYTSLMLSKNYRDYLEYKNKWLLVIRQKPQGLKKLPLSNKNVVRTILMARCSGVVLFLMKIRMAIYKTKRE